MYCPLCSPRFSTDKLTNKIISPTQIFNEMVQLPLKKNLVHSIICVWHENQTQQNMFGFKLNPFSHPQKEGETWNPNYCLHKNICAPPPLPQYQLVIPPTTISTGHPSNHNINRSSLQPQYQPVIPLTTISTGHPSDHNINRSSLWPQYQLVIPSTTISTGHPSDHNINRSSLWPQYQLVIPPTTISTGHPSEHNINRSSLRPQYQHVVSLMNRKALYMSPRNVTSTYLYYAELRSLWHMYVNVNVPKIKVRLITTKMHLKWPEIKHNINWAYPWAGQTNVLSRCRCWWKPHMESTY